MVMVIGVSGLIPYDSGKTWFTLGSALYAKRIGLRVGVFKPIAAHSLWYSPRTIRKSIELGLLMGNDILFYYENRLVEDPALSNPIAMATIPPDPLYYSSLDIYMRDLEDTVSTTVLSRVTSCRDRGVRHYFHREVVEKTTPYIERFINKILERFRYEEKPVDELIKYLYSINVEQDLDICLGEISRSVDIVFVESFNDAITPYISLLSKINTLVVVTPTRILVYRDMEKIKETIRENTRKHGYEGLRSRHTVEKTKPDTTLQTKITTKPKIQNTHREFINKITQEKQNT